MRDIELHASTGVEYLDDLLRGLIALFEMSFPTRIRSYYLGGSYSDGTAVGHDQSSNSSDVDLFVIFRGTVAEDENAIFQHLVTECQPTSPVQVDAHAYSEDDLLQKPRPEATQTSFLSALIREASVLVYGDDIRADLHPIPFPRYVLDVIESGVFHPGLAHLLGLCERVSWLFKLIASAKCTAVGGIGYEVLLSFRR